MTVFTDPENPTLNEVRDSLEQVRALLEDSKFAVELTQLHDEISELPSETIEPFDGLMAPVYAVLYTATKQIDAIHNTIDGMYSLLNEELEDAEGDVPLR